MFKLTLFKTKPIKYKCILARFVFNDSNQILSKLSLRQKTFELYKQRYKSHQHILYSSYLELQENSELQKLYHNKIKSDFKSNHEPNVLKQGSKIPKNWMEDYEYYSGQSVPNLEVTVGTADPNLPPSKVPCNGCGANLQCNFEKGPGFLPSEIFKGRTENELKTVICKRCHFLKFYNQAIDIEVTPECYIETINIIKDRFALAVVIVDLLDFPSSILPQMNELLGSKRPVFIVGNKLDLLPRDSKNYLNHIKDCLEKEILRAGFDKLNVKYVSLISAKTGYGIEELITQLHKIWAYKGDVYLMGCTNVGKSSLFNILLNSDYCRPESIDLIRKATTSPWPGTTLHMLKFPIHRPSDLRVFQRFKRLTRENFMKAEVEKLRVEYARKFGNISEAVPIGAVGRTFAKNAKDVDDAFSMSQGVQPITTFNERSKEYKMARWVYDTPGVLHPDQITSLLNTQELKALQPKKMISPRAYRLKPGMTLFVAGLSRLDFIACDSKELEWMQIFLFASFDLPTMIVETDRAEHIYREYLNTPLMKIPMENQDRLREWPGLQCHTDNMLVEGTFLNSNLKDQHCSADITLSSIGWVGLHLLMDVNYNFRVWTPHAKGIHLRTPSLVPYAGRLIGKRIRNSLAYNTSKPFTFNEYKRKL